MLAVLLLALSLDTDSVHLLLGRSGGAEIIDRDAADGVRGLGVVDIVRHVDDNCARNGDDVDAGIISLLYVRSS